MSLRVVPPQSPEYLSKLIELLGDPEYVLIRITDNDLDAMITQFVVDKYGRYDFQKQATNGVGTVTLRVVMTGKCVLELWRKCFSSPLFHGDEIDVQSIFWRKDDYEHEKIEGRNVIKNVRYMVTFERYNLEVKINKTLEPELSKKLYSLKHPKRDKTSSMGLTTL